MVELPLCVTVGEVSLFLTFDEVSLFEEVQLCVTYDDAPLILIQVEVMMLVTVT